MTTLELDELRLLTPAQARTALSVSPRQLDRLIAAQRLTPVRLLPGGNRRYRLSEIAQLIADKEDENDA